MATIERRVRVTGLSPREAAFATGVSEKTINQAIDREEIHTLPSRRRSDRERLLAFPDLLYLRLRSDVGRLLSSEGKRLLREELASGEDAPDVVAIGPLEVRIAAEVKRVEERVAQIERIRAFIVSDPQVRGGEPVVRGTRIAAHVLAELAGQGASPEELLDDYPSLTPESLEAALLYMGMNPRRGRPRRVRRKDAVIVRKAS